MWINAIALHCHILTSLIYIAMERLIGPSIYLPPKYFNTILKGILANI